MWCLAFFCGWPHQSGPSAPPVRDYARLIVITSITPPPKQSTTTQVTSANAQLKEGDIVTVRGKGRLEINAVEKTAKEKFRVKMTKFA